VPFVFGAFERLERFQPPVWAYTVLCATPPFVAFFRVPHLTPPGGRNRGPTVHRAHPAWGQVSWPLLSLLSRAPSLCRALAAAPLSSFFEVGLVGPLQGCWRNLSPLFPPWSPFLGRPGFELKPGCQRTTVGARWLSWVPWPPSGSRGVGSRSRSGNFPGLTPVRAVE